MTDEGTARPNDRDRQGRIVTFGYADRLPREKRTARKADSAKSGSAKQRKRAGGKPALFLLLVLYWVAPC